MTDQPLVTPETIDGKAVLDEAHGVLTTFCVLPSAAAADAVVLWIACTHALPSLPAAPRLAITSPVKRAGKTRLLEVVEGMAYDPLATMNATTAAVFRSLDRDHPPTLIFDEADTLFGSARVAENNEELRGLLNAGFQRGKSALRCVGPMQTPTLFGTFAMAALAGIGGLPDTITDRSVCVAMRRRKPGETVRPFRERRDRPRLDAAKAGLVGWLADEGVRDKLEASEPVMELEDRAADVWEGLVAVADLAGGDWPDRARAAARRLIAAADDEGETSDGLRLLHDMADLFESKLSDFAPTTQIVIPFLRDIEDAPWRDTDLTSHRLGKMLGEFGIRSVRDKGGKVRGYRRSDFRDAWERYPRPPADQASEASEAFDTPSELHEPSDASMAV